jgi:hypothetical protein
VQGRKALIVIGVRTVRRTSSNNPLLPHPPSSRRESRPARERATGARFNWRAVGRHGSTGPAIGRLSWVVCVPLSYFRGRPHVRCACTACGARALRAVRVHWLPKPVLFLQALHWLCIRIFLLGMFIHSHFFSIGVHSLFSYWSYMCAQPLLYDWGYIQPLFQTIDLPLSSLPFRGLSIFAISQKCKRHARGGGWEGGGAGGNGKGEGKKEAHGEGDGRCLLYMAREWLGF